MSSEALRPADNVVETRAKIASSLCNHKWRKNGKLSSEANTGALFCAFLRSNNQLLSKMLLLSCIFSLF